MTLELIGMLIIFGLFIVFQLGYRFVKYLGKLKEGD